ncbi:hypothetical protein BLNAU_4139 [Blattamonas nauphoetae]|uniref:Uncharacterized protein n=1 Tax=Blattamonas nauphoetae TaxID=2049346 RepID=A0ABQ9YAN2_9EUKA|nr:hypothetical protein BLNAU_4139 [Blattamonas nauphoetae]
MSPMSPRDVACGGPQSAMPAGPVGEQSPKMTHRMSPQSHIATARTVSERLDGQVLRSCNQVTPRRKSERQRKRSVRD